MTDFWRGRRVLVTGHTGFKGSWLCLWLERLGAQVSAFALPPATEPSLYALAAPWDRQNHVFSDLLDAARVREVVLAADPEVTFHLAAQPLVRASYRDPVGTYASNLLGTVHLLDALRAVPGMRACVVVTTDKVYENQEQGRAFVEGDRLGGKDPYSNSKACVELAVQSFRDSFLKGGQGFAVATARAGNVVGGGDWAEDRLVPDMLRAFEAGKTVELRYPDAVRPWQHVLDPLAGYIRLAEGLATNPGSTPLAVNFGPDPDAALTVAQVVELLGANLGIPSHWTQAPGHHPPEAAHLTLDSALAHDTLGWASALSPIETFRWTAEWHRGWCDGADVRTLTLGQIARYDALCQQEASLCQ